MSDAEYSHVRVPPPWKTVSIGGTPRGVVRKVKDAAAGAATGLAAGAVNALAVTINGVARALEAVVRRRLGCCCRAGPSRCRLHGRRPPTETVVRKVADVVN